MSTPSRLLIIGIDGADYVAVKRWLDRGKLPHLDRLLDKGRLLGCRSTRPAVTAPAWTTALTGCNPGKHGIYDFWDFSFPDRRIWWSLPRGCPSLWRRLSDAGLRCGVVNAPMAFPAEEINGEIITGPGSPGLPEAAFHPPSLRDELREAVPDYSLHPDGLGPTLWPGAETFIHYADLQARAAKHLLDTREFDVFMVLLNTLDWAGHGYACEQEDDDGLPLAVARAIDDHVGDLVARTDWPKTPVMVVSDHGMRCTTRQVNLYKLFVQLGLMQVRAETGKSAGKATALIGAWNLAKRILPTGVISWLRRAGEKQREAVLADAPRTMIDWARTVAAPVGPMGTVRLNVRGRDPEGVVAPEDYETTRQDVIDRLRAVEDPATGEAIFGEVVSRDEAYTGDLMDGSPDIVLSPRAGDLAFGVALSDADLFAFMQQPGLIAPLAPPCGIHADLGILMLSGDDAAVGGEPADCSLRDFTPTALHLLNLPVPSYMDGRALTDHLTGEPAARPVRVIDEELPPPQTPTVSATTEDERILEERLRGLGYL